jgi:AmiR/NasT family two-component response regulator
MMLSDRRSAGSLDVLVVEPKDLVAARLKTQLASLGHRVLARARDGREALTAAQQLHPSLIVMESKLPGLDGIDAARAIVAEQAVPVILLTAYAGAELVRRAKEAGVVAYLTTVDQNRLRAAIEVALERVAELRVVRRERSDPSEALETRRLVERAKKVLMTRLGISEAEAFLQVLKRAQSTGRSLSETAWTIINADEILPGLDVASALEMILHAVRPQLRAKPRWPVFTPADPAMVPDVDAESYRSPALSG